MTEVLGVVIGAVFLMVLIFVLIYNNLVRKKNQVENAFGGLDAMLKKRYDLLPNLVSTVGRYMKHEKSLLTAVTELRTKAISENLSSDAKIALNNDVTDKILGIMVAVENYPELKASQTFVQLQRAMNEIEEQISASRRTFNASVTEYNNAIEMFPANMFAAMLKYGRKSVFLIPETERQNLYVRDLFVKQ